MSSKPKGQVTLLLESLRPGDDQALEKLVTVVYRQLRRKASRLLKKESRPQ